MADKTAAKRGRYYDPPTVIRDMPGVVATSYNEWADAYRGTAEDLAAAGLLPLHLFPGQPDQPTTRNTLRPNGVSKGALMYSDRAPGYMEVFRQPDGSFRIVLSVSAEERKRRAEETKARDDAADAAAEAVLKEIPADRREYLAELVNRHGWWRLGNWFRDSAWLAEQGVRRSTADSVLSGLEVYRRADIERDLILHSMDDAAALLARISVGDRHG